MGSWKRLQWCFLPMCIVVILLLGYVWEETEQYQLSYEIRSLENQLLLSHDGHDRLSFDGAFLKSPNRLEAKMLSHQMDLAIPQQVEFIQIAIADRLVERVSVGEELNAFGLFGSIKEVRAEEEQQ